MFCNQEIETMPRQSILQLQMEKLRKTLAWTYEKSPFYKEKMNRLGLMPQKIRFFEEIPLLPFTTKEDLIEGSPFDFLTGPLSSTIRLRLVGLGQPIARAYTSGDVARNVELMARALFCGGINMASVFQIMEEYSSEDALTAQYAAEILGATVVPSSPANLERVLRLIDIFGVTALASTSQQLLQLLVAGQALENDLKATGISTIFLFNETVKNNMKDHLVSRFGTNIFNIYGPAELGCVCVAFDCMEKAGLHLQEDCFYAEVVSMTDQQPLEEGRVGELVLTSLSMESMPVIRYRTGQIVYIDRTPCRCGRSSLRIKVP